MQLNYTQTHTQTQQIAVIWILWHTNSHNYPVRNTNKLYGLSSTIDYLGEKPKICITHIDTNTHPDTATQNTLSQEEEEEEEEETTSAVTKIITDN